MPFATRRAEWLMVKVLAVYWNFLDPGDHYLDRMLASMDPKKPYLGNLPPYWKLQNLVKNEDVAHAMNMLFGYLFKKNQGDKNNPCALLLQCSACIVDHLSYLLSQTLTCSGHNFTQILILQEITLLERLL